MKRERCIEEFEWEDIWCCHVLEIVEFLTGKGIDYVCEEKGLLDGSPYWVYERTDELSKVLITFLDQ